MQTGYIEPCLVAWIPTPIKGCKASALKKAGLCASVTGAYALAMSMSRPSWVILIVIALPSGSWRADRRIRFIALCSDLPCFSSMDEWGMTMAVPPLCASSGMGAHTKRRPWLVAALCVMFRSCNLRAVRWCSCKHIASIGECWLSRLIRYRT